jgi:hypothetical protein
MGSMELKDSLFYGTVPKNSIFARWNLLTSVRNFQKKTPPPPTEKGLLNCFVVFSLEFKYLS